MSCIQCPSIGRFGLGETVLLKPELYPRDLSVEIDCYNREGAEAVFQLDLCEGN